MNFSKLCNKYLTPDECKLLSYEQKVSLLNFTVKQIKKDRQFESVTGKGDISNVGDSLKDIGDTVNSLPLTDRQREICRYKCQKYIISEIADLLHVSERTIVNELIAIRDIVEANSGHMTPEHDVWHKKTSGHYDSE